MAHLQSAGFQLLEHRKQWTIDPTKQCLLIGQNLRLTPQKELPYKIVWESRAESTLRWQQAGMVASFPKLQTKKEKVSKLSRFD